VAILPFGYCIFFGTEHGVEMSNNEIPLKAEKPFARYLARIYGGLFVVLSISWAFQIAGNLGFAVFREQFLIVCLALAGGAVFLNCRFDRDKNYNVPWFDWLFSTLFVATCLYIASDYGRFLLDAPYETKEMLVMGAVLTLLVLEGMRRVAGGFLFIIVLCFVAYALLAHLVPRPLTGSQSDLGPLAIYLAFDTNALLGTPLAVATSIVVLFIFLGQVLFKTGGGEFFTDIAMATMGKRRGGGAKISVVASALFGSISGSAISNVTTTGVITIPLMRKSGYSAIDAGAIESNASTGGQFMPPIMGAAAFLMAEFLEIAYTEVMFAAIIPALLYYYAVFVQVDLVAARDNISIVQADLPDWRRVLRNGWHFILPFIILLFCLFHLREEAEISALYAAGAIVVLGFIRPYQGKKLNFKKLGAAFWDAGLATTELVLIVAAAGLVIGILNISGGGFALTLFLVDLGGGNLFVLLAIAALICIILGMGMPTSGVYVLLAALVAPSLVEVGVDKIAAHMFILYFGMMSMITPPIALAAFAAASLSRADPMATGFAAMRMGWVAYVIPFLFVLSPTLLALGDTVYIIIDTGTAAIGVYFVSVSMIGYFSRSMSGITRIALAIAGISAFVPDSALDVSNILSISGVVVGFAIILREHFSAKSIPIS
jgi:TRAP transporter 4TM/12TM fusion protein